MADERDGTNRDASVPIDDLDSTEVDAVAADQVKGGESATVKPNPAPKANFDVFTTTKGVDTTSV